MATNFPTSLDSFTNPTPVSDTNTVSHAGQHQNHNDSITALEVKVGVTGSAVNTTLDYKTAEITGGDTGVGKTAAQVLLNKTLSTATKILLGSDATGDMYYNGGSGTLTRVPIGSTGQILTVAAGVPGWASPASSNASYAASSGSVNAYIVNLTPALSSYSAGVLVQFLANLANTGTCTVNVNGLGAKTIKKLGGATDLVSGDIALGQIVELEYDGTNFQMLSPVANAPVTASSIKFGGNGSDGALTVTSGNTNIDLGGASFFVRNYTSISITGTGSITFTNPASGGTVIHLKSQGNVTLTSSAAPMIDASGCGTAGGAAGVNAGNGAAGTDISTTFGIYSTTTNSGGMGTTSTTTGGASTAITNPTFYGATLRATTLGNERLPVLLIPGAGGGGATSNNNPSSPGINGLGGNGGGALYIECAGAWNFTTTNGISVAGKNGTNGSGTTNVAGGGGGGAPGMFLALYNTLTVNSGTINVSAGSGGSPLAGVGTAYGGGGGSSAGNAGNAGSSATGGAGGAAIANAALVLQNNSIS